MKTTREQLASKLTNLAYEITPEKAKSTHWALTLADLLIALNNERAAWRQYACAAISSSRHFTINDACNLADAMMDEERVHFEAKP